MTELIWDGKYTDGEILNLYGCCTIVGSAEKRFLGC